MTRTLAWMVAFALMVLQVALAQTPAPEDPQQQTPPPVQAEGVLSGRVQTREKAPVAGAVVKLDSGQSAVTDDSGGFTIGGVPAGRHSISMEANGYKSASGAVTVEAGQTRSILFETRMLGSVPTTSPTRRAVRKPRTGTFYVTGYAKVGYKRNRTWVSKIEVWEYGNPGKTWSNYWSTDNGYSSRTLTCSGANLDKTYHIGITWKNTKSGATRYGTWEKKFWTPGQTETFYHP